MDVNVQEYEDYTRFVKEDMFNETYEFVKHILINDLSIMNFIDSRDKWKWILITSCSTKFITNFTHSFSVIVKKFKKHLPAQMDMVVELLLTT